jgi:hypothetical protein
MHDIGEHRLRATPPLKMNKNVEPVLREKNPGKLFLCEWYLYAIYYKIVCDISFIPLPVETLGGWHPKAVLQIKKLARAQARTTGKDEDEAIRRLYQWLAVLLVKVKAALLVNRIPSHPL